MEFSTTQEIHADLATVWAALGDPQNWVAWMDDLTDVKPEDGTTAPGPGARYSASQAWWRFDNQRLTIHDYQPNERLTYSAETTGGGVTFEYTLRQVDERHVAVHFLLRMDSTFAKVNASMSGPLLEKKLNAEAAQLRDYCEAQTSTRTA